MDLCVFIDTVTVSKGIKVAVILEIIAIALSMTMAELGTEPRAGQQTRATAKNYRGVDCTGNIEV